MGFDGLELEQLLVAVYAEDPVSLHLDANTCASGVATGVHTPSYRLQPGKPVDCPGLQATGSHTAEEQQYHKSSSPQASRHLITVPGGLTCVNDSTCCCDIVMQRFHTVSEFV